MIAPLPLNAREKRRVNTVHLFMLLMTLVLILSMLPNLAVLPLPLPEQAAPDKPAAVPPALAPDTPPAPDSAPPAYVLPPELIGKTELTTQRTASSATFDMGDGTYAVLQDTVPLHYQDSQGTWQPIDPAFAPVEAGWVNATNALHTALSQRSSSAKVGTDKVGTGWEPISLVLTGLDGESGPLAVPLGEQYAAPGIRSADGRIVRYSKSWSSASIQDQWHSSAGSSEYSMQLAALPPATGGVHIPGHLELRVKLHLRPGTTIEIEGERASLPLETSRPLSFVGKDDEVMLLQPPQAYEQQNRSARIQGSYLLQATADPSVVDLHVRIPWNWLSDSARAFPVIIDPLFQIRYPTTARSAFYRPNGTFSDNRALAPLEMGQFADGVQRLLVQFAMPPLPPGSNIDRAYLLATPTDVNFINRDYLVSNVLAYELTDSGWTASASAEPIPAATPLPPGQQAMSYSRGAGVHSGVTWDITEQARNWTGFFSTNNGILLRTASEFCKPDPAGCGGFYFAHNPSTWSNEELLLTETGSDVDNPYIEPTNSGGVRMLVFYTGPQLVENTPILMTAPFGGLPPVDPPYYHADHDYRVPPLPNDRWQAVVSRGFGPTFGPPVPDEVDDPYGLPLQGSMPMKLRSGNDVIQFAEVLPPEGDPGFILLNGRRNPDVPFRVRVGQSAGAPPLGYDVELLGEQANYDVPLNSSVEHLLTHDTGDPMALWNVSLPPGSNSRVDIEFYADNTAGTNTLYNNVRGFSGGLFNGANSAFLTPDSDNVPLRSNAPESGNIAEGSVRLTTGIFMPEAGNNALVLNYNGPQMDIYTITGGPPEFPNYGVLRMNFYMRLRITSCEAGSFPTASGICQAVQCPNSSFNAANYREAGDLGLWSASGWSAATSPATTIDGAVAPLIGDTGQAAPRVAVVGGTITYNGNNVTLSNTSSVLLVDCGDPTSASNPTPNYFQVYDGAMQRDVRGFIFPFFFSVLERSPSSPGALLIDPWKPNDRSGGDLTDEDFTISPSAGTAGGNATLRRRTGSDLFFSASWSVDVNGWPSLTSSIGEDTGNPPPPTIASLFLTLGDVFSLDTTSAGNKYTARYFLALRASQSTIIQPAAMGGDDEPVQTLILQRDKPVPSDPPQVCPGGSCIDLRALDDTPEDPNRVWKMPDVHTNVNAGTVLLSREGELLAFSKDHPAAHTQDINQEFSFDSFGASVSVQQEPCEQGGPVVTVIRGETRMLLPNIGSGTDPSNTVAAGFKLCETSLRTVHMSFSSSLGIPLGNSGLFLTGLQGQVDIFPDYTQIKFGLDFQAAQGGDGGIFKAHGEVIIDTRGMFAFQGTAKILGVVDANGKLWVAWNPLDIGFEVSVGYKDWLRGFARAHLWEGQGWQHRYSWLPDNSEKHIAAQIGATIKIEQGAAFSWWFIDIPPFDIEFGIEVAFGQFCTNSSCTSYEWGVKGKFTIVGYDIGLYYGFDEGFDFILGNDGHVLIDQYGGAQTSPIVRLAGAEAPMQVRAAQPAQNGTSTESFTVGPNAENILFALGWQAGTPELSLIDPDGTLIDESNASSHNATIIATGNSILFGVQNPQPGQWQARISNLSADGIEHYKFVYLANKGAPGTPVNRGEFLSPSAPNENGNSSYTIRWLVPSDAPISTTISLYISTTIPISLEVPPGVTPATRVQNLPIVQNLPFSQGSYEWNTSFLASGIYQVYAIVDDGVNDFPSGRISNPDDHCLPLTSELPSAHAFDPNRFPGTSIFTATGTVEINDTNPPATPTGLELTDGGGAILARWEPAPEPDIAAYLAQWGYMAGASFVKLGAQRITAVTAPTLRIGSLSTAKGLFSIPPNLPNTYEVQLAAIDASGNTSAFTPFSTITISDTAGLVTVPFAPVNLAVSAVTGSSASLTWEANPAGPAPASYQLRYSRIDTIDGIQQLDTTDTSATISELQTGAVYEVRVSALNSEGWNSASTAPISFTVTSGIDADSDGLPDDWAAAYGITGGSNDSDGDGLTNAEELAANTNPTVQDTDGDEFSDGEELAAGTDPLNSTSYGTAFTQPRLSLETDNLVFRPLLEDPASAPPQSVLWSNTGGGTLELEASTSASWLEASVDASSVRVSVDPDGLTPGFYSGVVRLTPDTGSDSLIGPPACIRVQAWVSSDVIGVLEADLSGPDVGINSTPYTFTVQTGPALATQPITYRWQATDQAEVVHTGGLDDTVSYTWDSSGIKTIHVTVSNPGYSVTTEHTIAIDPIGVQTVNISGPVTGTIALSYTFTADSGPALATQPITYRWQATDQEPITHTTGLNDSIGYSWSAPGRKIITLTASNPGSSVTTQQSIVIGSADNPPVIPVYLPFVLR